MIHTGNETEVVVLAQPEPGRKLGLVVCSTDGHRVEKVAQDTVAQQAGLEVNDLITHVGGESVTGISHDAVIKKIIELPKPLEIKIVKGQKHGESYEQIPDLVNPVLPRAVMTEQEKLFHRRQMQLTFGLEAKIIVIKYQQPMGLRVADCLGNRSAMRVDFCEPNLLCHDFGIVPGDLLVGINHKPLASGNHQNLPQLLQQAGYPLVLNFNAFGKGKYEKFKQVLQEGLPVKKFDTNSTCSTRNKPSKRILYMDSKNQIFIIGKAKGRHTGKGSPKVISVHDIEDINYNPSRNHNQFLIVTRQWASAKAQAPLTMYNNAQVPYSFFSGTMLVQVDKQSNRDQLVPMLKLLVKEQQHTRHLHANILPGPIVS